MDNWFGVNAPAHTPKATLARLVDWFKAAINDGEVKAKVASQGLYVLATCGDQYGALIQRRYDEYGQAIREFNLTQQ